ncbi:DNA polymerase III subunit delta [Corynebacterium liangguodongii]|uniref:DNA-directed DNA polymerase n=1 Tax=Corynebacterium liangguodongii TaxID=2079535 RepID=A0A2S0WFF0_9CORY|nr:DNA polymerase III subunit delta [Corynebacterium liangguodongii]AWB84498.1 DNA polymerase III subunit delta [Corynebacterium liangguodongii]PWB98716.1 DNA polymerase III subunit delta [Corynebacterium liangguodongii]
MVRMHTPVHLVLGEDEFLAERAMKAIIAELSPAVEVSTYRAGDISEGELAMATSPSLFAEERAVVFRDVDQAGKEPTELLLAAAKDPAPGMTLILMHSGGGRNKSYVPRLRKLAQVHSAEPLKDRDRQAWVSNEFRRLGVRPTPDVVAALLESVGSDLRELASAVSQLVADTEGEITVGAVHAYYTGVAEVSGFTIADQAVEGRVDRALASTRRALQLGVSPVAIAAALARKIGDIAKLYNTRGNPDQLARELGMHPFVARKTMQVARNWSGEAVSEAVIIVADLDAEVKGRGGDPEFCVENAVARISQLAR